MPERKVISEKMNVHEEWYEEARKEDLKTIEDLNKFVNDKMDNYCHDYGTICHAIASSMIATMTTLNNSRQGGITGFQASCIVQQVLMRAMYHGNKVGIRMLNMDHLLYPQYYHEFEKTITLETWEKLRKTAKENLDNKSENAHPSVVEHWQSIVDGNVPFGFVIKDEKNG